MLQAQAVPTAPALCLGAGKAAEHLIFRRSVPEPLGFI